MSTWWRRNRWALLALPFVLALALAVSGYRILTIWNPWHLTDPVEGEAGQTVHLVQDVVDGGDGFTVDVELTAGPARQVTTVRDDTGEEKPVLMTPADSVMWQIDLDVQADPTTVLRQCTLRLVDAQGRETANLFAVPGITSALSPCVPQATPGPDLDIGLGLDLDDGGPERPENYTMPLVFITSEDFVPARLDVSWATPRYAALELAVDRD